MKFGWILVLGIVMIVCNVSVAQVEFTELNLDNSCAGASSIYATNLDGDDDLDLLVAENEGNRLSWYRNDGGIPLVWTKFTIQNGLVGCHSVHANDFDNDGDIDVVSTTYGASIMWFRNDGGDPIEWTQFTITGNFSQAHEVYSADLDGNGRIDVLGAASAANRISAWFNDGGDPITWTEQVIDANCSMAKSVTAAYVNDDGRMDVISAGIADNDVVWYENQIGIPVEWIPHTIDSNFTGAHRVQGIDIDDDGNTDVLGTAYLGDMISWWRNDGSDPPEWTEQVIEYGFYDGCVSQAADIDGDGILDVVGTAQGSNRVAWFHSDGQDPITWTEHNLTTSFNRPWPLYVCDIDDDGDNDVLSASSYNGSNELKMWRNEGDGTFVEESTLFPQDHELTVFPNPFNAQTALSVTIPVAGQVTVRVYDVAGRLVAVPSDGFMSAGQHRIQIDGAGLASGTYFIRAEVSGQNLEMKKVVLLK